MPKHFSHFTDNLKFTVQISYGKDAKNKWDFSLVLKVCREFDDVTSAGKLFHVRAAATGTLGRQEWTVVYVEHPMPRAKMTAGIVRVSLGLVVH